MVCKFRAFRPTVLGSRPRYTTTHGHRNTEIASANTAPGWITVFAWVVNCAGPPAIIANIITALLIFNYDTYVPKSWHTMLLMWAFIVGPALFNFWFRRLVNVFETSGGVFHIIFFIVSIITLAVLAERSTPDFVFETLTRGESGWNNPGVSFGLGLLTITYSVSGQQWHPL